MMTEELPGLNCITGARHALARHGVAAAGPLLGLGGLDPRPRPQAEPRGHRRRHRVLPAPDLVAVRLGLYPVVTLDKQLLIMIGKLV